MTLLALEDNHISIWIYQIVCYRKDDCQVEDETRNEARGSRTLEGRRRHGAACPLMFEVFLLKVSICPLSHGYNCATERAGNSSSSNHTRRQHIEPCPTLHYRQRGP